MALISVDEDEELTSISSHVRGSRVEVRVKDSRVYEKEILYPKGEPENPLTAEDVRSKFIALAIYSGNTKEEAESIVSIVDTIETRFPELCELL